MNSTVGSQMLIQNKYGVKNCNKVIFYFEVKKLASGCCIEVATFTEQNFDRIILNRLNEVGKDQRGTKACFEMKIN